MIIEAQWSCEWCKTTKKISSFAAFFSWFLPRYCLPTQKVAGWPHPSCNAAAKLAKDQAKIIGKRAEKTFLASVHGQNLGTLRVKIKKEQ